jgi:hypothetical protein
MLSTEIPCTLDRLAPIIVPKSKEMVDLTMALFAKFRVNGNQDEILSRLG